MVSLSRTIRAGLLILAAGLAFGSAAASQEPKAGNPPAHGAEDAVETNKEAPSNQKATQPPAAPEKPSGKAAPADDPAAKSSGGQHDDKGPTWTDIVQAVSALIVMGFTGFLAWLSWRQHILETDLAADAEQQRADVKASIAESARAATAMETMAEAAQRSANAASTVQRPWIKLTVGKPRPAYVKEGRLYVHIPIRFTNVGMTPTNGFRMIPDCDPHPVPGEITLDQIMNGSKRKREKPGVIQDTFYPHAPYEAEPVFSISVDEISADQMGPFVIAVTFEVKYFWAGGSGNVGLAGTVRPAGHGPTAFNLNRFSEGRSVTAVFTSLDNWTS